MGSSLPETEFASNATKFEVLTACEKHFGVQMLHSDLKGVSTVEALTRYWHGRHEEKVEQQRRDETHWTLMVPSNVVRARVQLQSS